MNIKELETGCAKLCYDKKTIRDLVECGQKFRINKNSIVEIFLCDECETKIQTLKDVVKLIRVKMTHENRNLVLSILSDLCGEIEG